MPSVSPQKSQTRYFPSTPRRIRRHSLPSKLRKRTDGVTDEVMRRIERDCKKIGNMRKRNPRVAELKEARTRLLTILSIFAGHAEAQEEDVGKTVEQLAQEAERLASDARAAYERSARVALKPRPRRKRREDPRPLGHRRDGNETTTTPDEKGDSPDNPGPLDEISGRKRRDIKVPSAAIPPGACAPSDPEAARFQEELDEAAW